LRILASEARVGVLAAVAAAFGRVIAEVGAVLIVGGNIAGETRVLTTAIVQETRQARFGAAIALGIVLLVLSTIVNGGLTWLQTRGSADA
jgi:tungstate transport system permease protein